MDTASIQFVCFGLAVALAINLSHSRIWRSAVLFVANLAFLALLSREPVIFVPLAGFLVLGYAGLVLIRRGWPKSTVWSVLAVILAYAWLKKYTFLPGGIFIHSPYFVLGLSYIFFRVLHLLIETGDGVETRHIGPAAYLLYMLNFTTFVSGPIQRYDEFARDQFAATPIPLGPRMIGLQLDRIVRGFFKVNVLALFLNIIRVDALAQLSHRFPNRPRCTRRSNWRSCIRSSSTPIFRATSIS